VWYLHPDLEILRNFLPFMSGVTEETNWT